MSVDSTPARPERAVTGQIHVRPAEPRDLERLWALVREFAAFERLEHFLTGSSGQLGENLFGRGWPALECSVAERDGTVAGYAIYYGVYSTFWTRPLMWLEDIFVTDAHRGRGVGRALLRAVARVAVERGCARMDWVVLDWNTEAVRFYERLGALRPSGWHGYRLDEERLRELAGS